MIRVTQIEDGDVDDVVRLGKMFRDECGAHLPFDPEWTRTWLKNVVSDKERTFTNIFVAYKDSKMVGMFVGHAHPYAFNPSICAAQELWYVLPEFRSTGAAHKLIVAFEHWARKRGALEIFTGVVSEDSATIAKVGNMLRRLDFPFVGTYHRKRLV